MRERKQHGCTRAIKLLTAALVLACLTMVAARADNATTPRIVSLANYADPAATSVGLNGYLTVRLDATGAINPSNFVLHLNGRFIDGLTDTSYDDATHSLVFHLVRNSSNAAAWSGLLGSATSLTIPITVALGAKTEPTGPVIAIISGAGTAAHFNLAISSIAQLIAAAVAIVVMLGIVWGGARHSTLLKDNLLPQLAPQRQPYSLGRWQMAFWFSLIFASFIVLYVILWDFNTMSTQALILMGLSGTTGIFAVAVDMAKNTPVDDANTALRALGLNNYADVLRLRQEIITLRQSIGAKPPPDNVADLRTQLLDRERLLETYSEKVRRFASEGWYRDLTTDLNGSALHRVQMFLWTWVLGAVFVIGVWRNLAMPAFDDTLLALMGISSAGYIGFKYPEQQG